MSPPVRQTFRPVTHLICDCDGVLVDSETIAHAALIDALTTRLHFPGLAQAIEERLGLTIKTLISEISALAGVILTDDVIAQVRDDVEAAVRARQIAVPGIAAALREIGLPVAVASNSSLPRVREAVARSGVAALVGDRLFTADVVGAAKPAPAIYLAACAGFGVCPANCLAIEDSVAGVTAATGAGLQVLGFAGSSPIAVGPRAAERLAEHVAKLRGAGAFAVFDDMRALPRIVRAIQRDAQSAGTGA